MAKNMLEFNGSARMSARVSNRGFRSNTGAYRTMPRGKSRRGTPNDKVEFRFMFGESRLALKALGLEVTGVTGGNVHLH